MNNVVMIFFYNKGGRKGGDYLRVNFKLLAGKLYGALDCQYNADETECVGAKSPEL